MSDIYLKKEDIDEWVGKFFTKDLISIDDLIVCIEDLDSEVETLKEHIEELENDIRENYKPISPYDYYGVNEDDFH